MNHKSQELQQGSPKHAQQIRSLLKVRQFSEKHPAFPEGAMRWMIFNATSNGFAAAFVRVGRKVLVDEAEFFRCIDIANERTQTNTSRRRRGVAA